jgi:sporulation protein YlmC with PRC-barrel domain
MRRRASTAILLALMTTVASAQTVQPRNDQNRLEAGPPAQILTSIPTEGVTVTHWYKQNVYDPNDSKIGEIMDVLVDKSGKATALIVGVGGFLGAGEKDVAVPFDAVHAAKKGNNDWYLVMNLQQGRAEECQGLQVRSQCDDLDPRGPGPDHNGQRAQQQRSCPQAERPISTSRSVSSAP